MHHFFQTDITLKNLIWASRRHEFIPYQRINQAQGVADQAWCFASSLLMGHLDQLANKALKENKPIFLFLAVSRKKLTAGRHTTRCHRQIIRAQGDIAPAEKNTLAFIKKEQMRCFAWGMEKGWPAPEEKPADAPPVMRKFKRHCSTDPKNTNIRKDQISRQTPANPARPKW